MSSIVGANVEIKRSTRRNITRRQDAAGGRLIHANSVERSFVTFEKGSKLNQWHGQIANAIDRSFTCYRPKSCLFVCKFTNDSVPSDRNVIQSSANDRNSTDQSRSTKCNKIIESDQELFVDNFAQFRWKTVQWKFFPLFYNIKLEEIRLSCSKKKFQIRARN